MCYKKYRLSILVVTLLFSLSVFPVRSWSKTYTPNVHWVFCVDTSGSMKAKGKLDLLRQITQKIDQEFLDVKKGVLKTGDRITLFSFDENTRLEASVLFQRDDDLLPVKEKLLELNKRSGNLTFTSEALVRASDFIRKYQDFFETNALYIFTDGKSDPYSKRWSQTKIAKRKKRDESNFSKISQIGKEENLNIWLGILKWDAYRDAEILTKKIGKNAHLVDLTDFNRLSLERALKNFALTVRGTMRVASHSDIDLGTIPYRNNSSFFKKVIFPIETNSESGPLPVTGRIIFDPDNPSEIEGAFPVEIKTTDDKIVLNLNIVQSNDLAPGEYKGRLELLPNPDHFGALVISPSKIDIVFKKAGLISYYFWKTLVGGVLALLFLFYGMNLYKRKMPIKI